MAIKKVQIIPPNYTDIIHPETQADITKYNNSNSELVATNVQSAIDEIDTKTEENKTDILSIETTVGDVAITTTAKTVTGAINELDADIGNKATLITTDKTNLVNAVNETRQQINTLDAEVDGHELRLVKLENNIEYKVGSWAEVQDIVRRGLAKNIFAVGDQFVATYDSTEYVWNIIGIDHDTPTDTEYTHSLTIQTRDCLQNVQFDAPEPTNTDANRQRYGNNRYIHSAIKQWLNSNDVVFNWVSKHQYDAAPTGAPYAGPGFLKLLDPELVAVIGAVNKQVAKATVDGGGQDLFSDKVFLLSRKEIYGTDEGTVTGEKVYPFYSAMAGAATDAALAGRIKLLSNAARNWWLRSPYIGNSHGSRVVSTGGGVSSYYAHGANGLAPACCIV